MAGIDVKVSGANLVITVPINKSPELSKSKKSRIIAGTSGFADTSATVSVNVNGKKVSAPVRVSLNAIIPVGEDEE